MDAAACRRISVHRAAQLSKHSIPSNCPAEHKSHNCCTPCPHVPHCQVRGWGDCRVRVCSRPLPQGGAVAHVPLPRAQAPARAHQRGAFQVPIAAARLRSHSQPANEPQLALCTPCPVTSPPGMFSQSCHTRALAPSFATVQEYTAWPVNASSRVSPPTTEWARCSGPYALCSLANWSVCRGVDGQAQQASSLLVLALISPARPTTIQGTSSMRHCSLSPSTLMPQHPGLPRQE